MYLDKVENNVVENKSPPTNSMMKGLKDKTLLLLEKSWNELKNQKST
jgi:hypothetical protein